MINYEVCPNVNQLRAATMSYEIFLSYAHADAEKYGQDYIDEIKRRIEGSIGEKDVVFLDTQALGAGDAWNAAIQKSLDESKVFIYLLSENYLRQEYCARERLWWAQKEMAKGRLHQTTLPVFYIQIDTDDPEILKKKENCLYLQTNADTPWFPEGAQLVAGELVKQRLNIARIRELQKKGEKAAQSSCSIPPYKLNFVGRISELCRLREICSHSGMAPDSIPVIHGEAGCGKSEISFAYAHGYASEYPGGRFFIPMEHVRNWSSAWLKLGDEIDMKSGLPVYSGTLGLSEDDRKKVTPEEFAKKLAQNMLTRVNEVGRTLILLDNIDCMELLSEAGLTNLFHTRTIPENLDIIATTRNRFVPDGCSKAVAVTIGNLGEEAALELLRLHCGNAPFNLAPPENDEKTTAEAKALLKFLEYHAWSVEIIAGYLGKEQRYGSTPQKILASLKQKFEIKTKYNTFRDDSLCMEALLQPTIDRIRELELGSDILELAGAAAMFAPDAVSVKLLESLWKKRCGEKSCSHADSWLWAWETLKSYHLLSQENRGISRMHRITHAVFRKHPEEKLVEFADDIRKILAEKEETEFTAEDAQAIAGLAQFILERSWKEQFFQSILEWIEKILLEWYRLEDARSLLAKLEQLSGNSNDFEFRAYWTSVQGKFYQCSNQYAKALEYFSQALSIRQQNLPDNHSAIAISCNNLGCVYKDIGDDDKAFEFYTKALESYTKALSIQKQIFPENHPAIAASCNNLGNVYRNIGDYDKALESHTKALSIQKQIFPENHPAIADSCNNLENVYAELGDNEKALEFHTKALSIREQISPENHPAIAASCNNHGNVYKDIGDCDKALESHTKALSIQEQIFPENHPAIAASCNNLGNVYKDIGDYAKALESYTEALSILQQILPENHPAIAASCNNHGNVYKDIGDYDKALESYTKALSILQQILPDNHPDIVTSCCALGRVCERMGDYDKALEHYSMAKEILLENLGEEHPHAQRCIEEINMLKKRLRRWGWWIKLKRFFSRFF